MPNFSAEHPRYLFTAHFATFSANLARWWMVKQLQGDRNCREISAMSLANNIFIFSMSRLVTDGLHNNMITSSCGQKTVSDLTWNSPSFNMCITMSTMGQLSSDKTNNMFPVNCSLLNLNHEVNNGNVIVYCKMF